MSTGIEVDDTKVLRVLHGLADLADDLTPAHQKAGELLLTRAGPRTPRRSGRLAASGRVDADSSTTSIVYDEPYAGVIHNGWPARNIAAQPWAEDTVRAQETEVVGVFADEFRAVIRRDN